MTRPTEIDAAIISRAYRFYLLLSNNDVIAAIVRQVALATRERPNTRVSMYKINKRQIRRAVYPIRGHRGYQVLDVKWYVISEIS